MPGELPREFFDGDYGLAPWLNQSYRTLAAHEPER